MEHIYVYMYVCMYVLYVCMCARRRLPLFEPFNGGDHHFVILLSLCIQRKRRESTTMRPLGLET
jgi:hypothetical protein